MAGNGWPARGRTIGSTSSVAASGQQESPHQFWCSVVPAKPTANLLASMRPTSCTCGHAASARGQAYCAQPPHPTPCLLLLLPRNIQLRSHRPLPPRPCVRRSSMILRHPTPDCIGARPRRLLTYTSSAPSPPRPALPPFPTRVPTRLRSWHTRASKLLAGGRTQAAKWFGLLDPRPRRHRPRLRALDYLRPPPLPSLPGPQALVRRHGL